MEVSNNKIYLLLLEELKKEGDKDFASSRNQLIGKKIISYGTRTAEIRRITKKYWQKFCEGKTEKDWFEIVEKLLSTKVFDNQMAGIFLLGVILKKFSIEISIITRLISKYIDNWATCDAISSEIAKKLRNSPENVKKLLLEWIKSQNPFIRRVAVVTLIKLKGKIENWKKITSQVLSFLNKEKDPITKKAFVWLKKETLLKSGV